MKKIFCILALALSMVLSTYTSCEAKGRKTVVASIFYRTLYQKFKDVAQEPDSAAIDSAISMAASSKDEYNTVCFTNKSGVGDMFKEMHIRRKEKGGFIFLECYFRNPAFYPHTSDARFFFDMLYSK